MLLEEELVTSILRGYHHRLEQRQHRLLDHRFLLLLDLGKHVLEAGREELSLFFLEPKLTKAVQIPTTEVTLVLAHFAVCDCLGDYLFDSLEVAQSHIRYQADDHLALYCAVHAPALTHLRMLAIAYSQNVLDAGFFHMLAPDESATSLHWVVHLFKSSEPSLR